MKKDPRIKRSVAKDPRMRAKSLGPHEEDDDGPPLKRHFRPYGQPPPQSILKPPTVTSPRTPTATGATPTEAFQLYSDGNRVYLGPVPVQPAINVPPAPIRPPPPPKRRPKTHPPRQKKQENSANFKIYPSNAGKSLLKKPEVTRIGFDSPQNKEANSITFPDFTLPPPSIQAPPPILQPPPITVPYSEPPPTEPYNPIRVPANFIKKFEPSFPPPSSSQAVVASFNPSIRPPIFSNPPPKITIYPKDDEIEMVKVVKHPIMRHHRSGGGQDIRKLREIYGAKKGALPNSSSELLSPRHEDTVVARNESPEEGEINAFQNESEVLLESEYEGQSQNTVAENEVLQFGSENVEESQMGTVVARNKSPEDQERNASQLAPEAVVNETDGFNEFLQSIQATFHPPENLNIVAEKVKEPKIPHVTINEEPTQQQQPTTSKRTKPSTEDGELSRSPSPEYITIDDSDDDDIIEIKEPSPKGRYKGQTAFGLDLYLNNLGKPAETAAESESEPLNIFFDMKLFYQHYEAILQSLVQENEDRTTFAHGIIDQLCEIGASLEVYFLMSGDVLEESRADEEFSEIQIYIASISDDKNVDVTSLMEPVYNVIKEDSNIGTVTFYSNTNVIVIMKDENNIAIRPLDKLAWARSSLCWACGNKVPVFKSALLLIKKAIRQFRTSEDLPDFIISFALIHYFQQIEVFPPFDYDLDEIDIIGAVDATVLKQPTKKANEIFSDFLFFIRHNPELTIECPFTKEQFDIKETLLFETTELIFGK